MASKTEKRCRVRDLGVTIGQIKTGKFNAITDVPGVRVGHETVSFGKGKLKPSRGPARTGVTAIMPQTGTNWQSRVTAGTFVLNGNGLVTGFDLVNTWGLLEGPILLTNTLNLWKVGDAAVDWMIAKHPDLGDTEDTYIPIVGECDDSSLNDIQGRHVRARHVCKALDNARSGPVAEGDVGAGKGMICYDFKGGIGTSSRKLSTEYGGYTVGVLVNCNQGSRHQLKFAGFDLGKHIPEDIADEHSEGSICIVVATDAPLNPLQLQNLAKRAALGLARTGSSAAYSSGDFVIAFSTGRKISRSRKRRVIARPELQDARISSLYEAAAEATEEAILNALCMANTVVGRDGNRAVALPLVRTVEILKRHKLIS
jgi:D-aminopeptidase